MAIPKSIDMSLFAKGHANVTVTSRTLFATFLVVAGHLSIFACEGRLVRVATNRKQSDGGRAGMAKSSVMGQSKYDSTLSGGIGWVDNDPQMHAINGDRDCIYTIGDLAREFDVTFRALRFYESKALLAPRRDGQTRHYSAKDRARLALILKAKRLGFTLTEIHDMIAVSEGHAEACELSLTREKCFEQITLLERQKREVEAALSELRRIYTSFYARTANDDFPPQ
jgi:DNA-binding transcriptional MerR regulator